MKNSKKIIIVGAGPAGLTAANELIRNGYNVQLFERENYIGGISRTAVYKGNHIDIGGHRFFSKSDTVMNFWHALMPYEDEVSAPSDEVMLKRSRLSRILWMRRLFDYPLKFSLKTISNMGYWRTLSMGISYFKSMLFPVKPEKNLEDFFINRFGRKLYLQFFKSYTEKVWGVPCSEISSAWGAQRIKGISILKAVMHAIKPKRKNDIAQKDVETSLIDTFLYPKYGPGQMWELLAKKVQQEGGRIELNSEVSQIFTENGKITGVEVVSADGSKRREDCDVLFSSMPIKELVGKIDGCNIPADIREIAAGLMYRDFITVGVLCSKINIRSDKMENGITKDNWIYIQESDVKVGRLQIFNNWSPYLVADKSKVWMGLEYFCQEGDELWNTSESDMAELAKSELEKCAIVEKQNVLDCVVIKMKKAYPAYFGTYPKFNEVRKFLDTIENLYCIGRNGQHRYNNMDHSMLSAMEAVNVLTENISSKDSVWNVNAEKSYHESK